MKEISKIVSCGGSHFSHWLPDHGPTQLTGASVHTVLSQIKWIWSAFILKAALKRLTGHLRVFRNQWFLLLICNKFEVKFITLCRYTFISETFVLCTFIYNLLGNLVYPSLNYFQAFRIAPQFHSIHKFYYPYSPNKEKWDLHLSVNVS